MNFRYVGHACVLMSEEDFTIITDPWFGEPLNHGVFHAFPIIDPLTDREIAEINAIHISHLHQDHFAPQSLARFPKSIPIVIAKHESTTFRKKIAALGFTNFREIEPNFSALNLGPFQLMTMRPPVFDGSFDSALIVTSQRRSYFLNNDCLLPETAYTEMRVKLGKFEGCFLGYDDFLPGPTCFRMGTARENIHPAIQKIYEAKSKLAWAHFSKVAQILEPAWVAPYASGIRFLNADLKVHNRTFSDARRVSEIPLFGATPFLIQPGDFIREGKWEDHAERFMFDVEERQVLPPTFENKVSATELTGRSPDCDRFFFDLISRESKKWREPMQLEILIRGETSTLRLAYSFDGTSLARGAVAPDISISYPAALVYGVIDARVNFAALHFTYRFDAEIHRYVADQMSIYHWGDQLTPQNPIASSD